MEEQILSREEIVKIAAQCGREDRKVVGGMFTDGIYKTGIVTKKHFAGLKRRDSNEDLYVPSINFTGSKGVGDFTISQVTANGIKVVKNDKGVEEPVIIENATTKSHRLASEAVNPHLKGEEVDILYTLQNRWVKITNTPTRVATEYPKRGEIVAKDRALGFFKTSVVRNLPHIRLLTDEEVKELQ